MRAMEESRPQLAMEFFPPGVVQTKTVASLLAATATFTRSALVTTL